MKGSLQYPSLLSLLLEPICEAGITTENYVSSLVKKYEWLQGVALAVNLANGPAEKVFTDIALQKANLAVQYRAVNCL